jgi:WD40 repeat protein
MVGRALHRVCLPTLVLVLSACTSNLSDGVASPPARSTPRAQASMQVPKEVAKARVVFVREHGVFEARADGSAERLFIDLEGVFEYQPDWSPDGRWLALRVDDTRAGGTVLVSSDGGRVDYIARDLDIVGGSADWAPDSRHLVLAGTDRKSKHFGLFVVDRERRTATRITSDRYEAQYPAWSPDGKWIAFTRVEPSTNTFDLWKMRPDGRRATQLTATPEAENYSAWSPDGRRLAYSSEATDGIWIMDADGSAARSVAPGGEPQWEPEELIIFDCAADEASLGRTCVVRPDGTGLTQLPLGPEAVFPNWAPRIR